MRRIRERAREFMESSREKKKMESYGHTCVVDKMQEKKKKKKKRKPMTERKAKNKKSQFKITITIFS